ncbi:hypothetical protein PHPALM_4287 [Phytophthora palmivora]|uniref:Uncharacterized protein n=1 Tax=Phytophthora palmivora TaxID=4796 RepID=A0A2P4YK59_9STRA|nr:hypothetical protein PHPALM_4287 [Phytophthora palmivora]
MDQDRLSASTAILAAVSAATLASNVQAGVDEPNLKREFGSVTYERVLPEGDCQCVERTTKKLQNLDNFVHVWVRDARSFRHGVESTVPYFSLRVAVSIPVSELRVCLVQENFTLLSPYRKEVDGELQLCFDNHMLDDEESFSAYLPGGITTISNQKANSTGHREPSWPKPFAGELFILNIQQHISNSCLMLGILWVLPWRPSRKQPLQWGNGENATTISQHDTHQDQNLQ